MLPFNIKIAVFQICGSNHNQITKLFLEPDFKICVPNKNFIAASKNFNADQKINRAHQELILEFISIQINLT